VDKKCSERLLHVTESLFKSNPIVSMPVQIIVELNLLSQTELFILLLQLCEV